MDGFEQRNMQLPKRLLVILFFFKIILVIANLDLSNHLYGKSLYENSAFNKKRYDYRKSEYKN